MPTRGEGISRLWTGVLGQRVGIALLIAGLVVGVATLFIDSRGLIEVRYIALFVAFLGSLMFRTARRDGPRR